MRFAIPTSYLLNLERLKEKLRWTHIAEEKSAEGERIFHLRPEHPEGFDIKLFVADDYEDLYLVTVGELTHWHLDDGWVWRWRTVRENLRTVRDLVSGRRCILETRLAGHGQATNWSTVKAGEWPEMIFQHECLPAGPGGSPGDTLISPDGKQWRPPRFKRYFFDRPPFEDQPDWGSYVPVRYGWGTTRKRDELLYMELTIGW